MTTTLDGSNLTLKDVHRLLNLERRLNNDFASLLNLESITEIQQQRLDEIRDNFEQYYNEGNILEGEVKLLFVFPLLWLSGFYSPGIKISLEEKIAEINLENEGINIKGRIDILAVKRGEQKNNFSLLWILIIESKRIGIDASEGLPQLLTYAYSSLKYQDFVWGLTTNGMDYQFIYLQKGIPNTYQLFSKLNLMYPEQAIQLLQILREICQ